MVFTIVTLGASSTFASGSAVPANWITYHNDLSRSGYDGSSNNSPPPAFLWESKTLDGAVYAEPLIYDGMVIVATENNSVYALSPTSGHVIWRKHLGAPVPGSSLPCGDINPSGITGTPAIDPATNTIYVTAYLANPTEHHVLFGLDANTGKVVFRRNVDPAGVSVLVEQERGALAISGGVVYVPFGGLAGDCGTYHGYVVGVPENGSARFQYKDPTGIRGGIWAPSGASVNSAGDLFVATGNSGSTTKFDFGDAVIELSPTLHEISYFAPKNWASLNSGDLDLGSAGPAILNDSGLVFQIGKQGVGYLLNETALGGIGGQLFSKRVCPSSSGGAFGGIAYVDSTIFVPCTSGIVAINANFTADTFSTLWSGPSFQAGPPVISNDLVWTVGINNAVVYALNMTSGQVVFSYSAGTVEHFTSPAASSGQVYVAAGSKIIGFEA